jgi:4-hydroxy-2-oxoheptanedioate aldolase
VSRRPGGSRKINGLKQHLAAGRPTFGTWVSLAHPWSTRVLARAGFDWLTVDLEHAPIAWDEAALMFALIADNGCVPLARVPAGSHDHIKRALDGGAWGVIVPMVDTAAQAAAAVAAAKYPPVGERSTGGGLHALSFGTTTADYYANADDQIVVVVQIESPTGIANLRDICAVPGVDAVLVGPNDLRTFMRTASGPPSAAEFEAAIERVRTIGAETGMPTGIVTFDPESALARAASGMTLIGVGSDVLFMTTRATEVLQHISAGRDGRASQPPLDAARDSGR